MRLQRSLLRDDVDGWESLWGVRGLVKEDAELGARRISLVIVSVKYWQSIGLV